MACDDFTVTPTASASFERNFYLIHANFSHSRSELYSGWMQGKLRRVS